jgi:alpha-aminoadipate/glutamate carrier protein LysW
VDCRCRAVLGKHRAVPSRSTVGFLNAHIGRSSNDATRRCIDVNAECPECGGTITFKSSPMLTELVTSPDCGAELAVTSVEPIDLQLAPTEEEDWGE